MLEFNSAIHEFRYDGRIIPSVTQVLKAAGLIDAQPHGDTWYADRGTAVHLATALYDENDLDETTLDPEIVPYLDAWKKFRAEMICEFVEKPELQVYSALGYAGIIDRVVKLGDYLSVVDIKTGVSQKWWGLQLSAYARAYIEPISKGFITIRRFAVQLTNEGTYRMTEYTDRNDFAVFQACLAIQNWKGNK